MSRSASKTSTLHRNEGALSPELLAQIKAIQLRTQRLVSESLAGQYESAFKGRGMEFEQVREYQPGDDIRHIDWNVTARMSAPFVKEHREERELTVMLAVDSSSSGAFGSQQRLKREIAAEVAAILAYTAIKSHDRVGLMVFSDDVELFIPAKKGRAHVWRVVREVLTHRAQGRATDIEGALQFLGRVMRRRAVVFLISDFLDEGFEDRLQILARRHDLTAITIADPREVEFPPVGLIELRDAETGTTLLVDGGNRRLREEYKEASAQAEAARAEMLRRAGVGRIAVRTDQSHVEAVVRYFRERERR